jgi:hypothetical protein
VLAAYVSGHGYGHATRTAEVLRLLRERAPGLPITVCTSAPAALFTDAVAPPLSVRAIEVDVGLVQKDALTIDEAGSADAVARFLSGWPALVEREARWLEDAGAVLVLGDIPPLSFAAAAEAGVPSIALGNFSWDWIYRHLARRHPALAEAAAQAADAYARATLLLELPFAGDLSAFPRRERIPLVARRPQVEKAEARRRLGLGTRPAVLVSFGGLGLPGFRAASLAGLPDYEFLTSEPVEAAPAHVHGLPADKVDALELGYADVVGAVDVVVTKPGYGIVSDAIGAGTRLVYTERGDFPEYPVMVRDMGQYLPAVHVSNDEVREGRLRGALEQVLATPFPARPDLSGAAVAARRILEVAASP